MASKSGAKGRKIGRNKKWCEGYRAMGREELNRKRRMMRHEKRMAKHAAKLKCRAKRKVA